MISFMSTCCLQWLCFRTWCLTWHCRCFSSIKLSTLERGPKQPFAFINMSTHHMVSDFRHFQIFTLPHKNLSRSIMTTWTLYSLPSPNSGARGASSCLCNVALTCSFIQPALRAGSLGSPSCRWEPLIFKAFSSAWPTLRTLRHKPWVLIPDASHPSVWYEQICQPKCISIFIPAVSVWCFDRCLVNQGLCSFNQSPLMGQGTVWRGAALLPFQSLLTCRFQEMLECIQYFGTYKYVI